MTLEEFDRFVRATDRELEFWEAYLARVMEDEGGRLPVHGISWNDAAVYAAWLSEETGGVYRSPSESEWEYAARAGTTTRYAWGQDIGRNRANCDSCGSRWDGRAPVGAFAPNSWGLYDMHGNVAEWVEDCRHYGNLNYAGAPSDGSAWLIDGNCGRRMVRGGNYQQHHTSITSHYRWHSSVGASDTRGTRVARTLESLVSGAIP